MEEFQAHHRTLPNLDLVRIAFFELKKVKKEARQSAKSILVERNIQGEQLEEIKKQVRRLKREEGRRRLKDKNDTYSWWNFVIDIFFQGL